MPAALLPGDAFDDLLPERFHHRHQRGHDHDVVFGELRLRILLNLAEFSAQFGFRLRQFLAEFVQLRREPRALRRVRSCLQRLHQLQSLFQQRNDLTSFLDFHPRNFCRRYIVGRRVVLRQESFQDGLGVLSRLLRFGRGNAECQVVHDPVLVKERITFV